MNFFKSVFSSDPDPSDSSSEGKSPPDSPHKPQDEKGEEETLTVTEEDSEPSYGPNSKNNTPWVGLGSLIKTFASKSESVIQTYRRDLEEFGSGLKKETAVIREVATRAVLDLPSSLEAGATAAQESLESVGQAIDDFGGSVWRGTAEIISEGKDALLAADSDAETHSSDLQTPSVSKRYSRFEVQVLAMQSDPSTFSEEPEDAEDFSKWMSEFKLEEKEEEIETLCYDNGTLEGLFEKLVPSLVDYDTFWTRYFYKLYKLKQAEDVRANLVKRVISREDEDEDLTWEVDDDEVDGKNEEEAEKDGEGEINEEIKEEYEAKAENEEESQGENVEERKEKGTIDGIELVQEKKPDGVPEDLSLVVSTAIDNEIVASSMGAADDNEPASNESTTKSDDKLLPDAKSEHVESCKDSDISIVSSQTSLPEEEDLGWDEIEDLGEHDDKKVGESSSTMNRDDLHKRLGVVEEDEDLTWDIEDDDEPAKP